MKKSLYYNLNKPDYADQYDLRHWNENTDLIDRILKNHADAISSEATARTDADMALVTRIDKIVNGDTVVGKANKDADGNIIIDTYQTKSNKVNSWQNTPDNNHYPSEKLTKDSLDLKIEKVRINNTIVQPSDNEVNLTVSFRITDGTNNGATVSMSNGLVTIALPTSIYGAVFN